MLQTLEQENVAKILYTHFLNFKLFFTCEPRHSHKPRTNISRQNYCHQNCYAQLLQIEKNETVNRFRVERIFRSTDTAFRCRVASFLNVNRTRSKNFSRTDRNPADYGKLVQSNSIVICLRRLETWGTIGETRSRIDRKSSHFAGNDVTRCDQS